MVLKFSHLAKALGGKVRLFKVTNLGEEVGAGTGAHVKPVQPQRTRHIHLLKIIFPSFSSFLFPMNHCLPEPTQWPLRQRKTGGRDTRDGFLSNILWSLQEEDHRPQQKEVKGEGSGRVWERFHLSSCQNKPFTWTLPDSQNRGVLEF